MKESVVVLLSPAIVEGPNVNTGSSPLEAPPLIVGAGRVPFRSTGRFAAGDAVEAAAAVVNT